LILRRIGGLQKGIEIGPLSIFLTPSWFQKIEMFKIQFAYGQREILLDYMGLSRTTLLMGILQHGLTYGHDSSEVLTPRFPKFERSPLWVYSESRARSLAELGHTNVKAIGAPWLYLPPIPKSFEVGRNSDRYVVFPIHTSLSVDASPDENEIRRKIRIWKSISGDSPITVCLYWSDYLEWSWRRIAKSEGVDVTVLGVPETAPVYWSPHSARIDFLVNLRNLLNENSHAIFETFTSAIFYAIETGTAVGYFPETQTESESQLHLEADRWFSKEIPGIIGEFVEASTLLDRNNGILGVESLRSPSELRDLLNYEVGVVPRVDVESN